MILSVGLNLGRAVSLSVGLSVWAVVILYGRALVRYNVIRELVRADVGVMVGLSIGGNVGYGVVIGVISGARELTTAIHVTITPINLSFCITAKKASSLRTLDTWALSVSLTD